MKKGRGVGGHVTYVDGGDGSAAVESVLPACRGLGGRRRDEGAGGGAGARHAPVHAGT